jgi:hypothetical protein
LGLLEPEEREGELAASPHISVDSQRRGGLAATAASGQARASPLSRGR